MTISGIIWPAEETITMAISGTVWAAEENITMTCICWAAKIHNRMEFKIWNFLKVQHFFLSSLFYFFLPSSFPSLFPSSLLYLLLFFAGDYNCCKFMTETVMSGIERRFLQNFFLCSASHILLHTLFQWSWEGDIYVSLNAKQSKVTHMSSCDSLLWLPPNTKDSFSD